MKKIIYGILVAFFISIFSSFAYADENCEMPPGIDDDEIYWIHFKNESKMYRYKILEIEDCWVQIWKETGNHYWYRIDNIMVMTSDPEES
ncbi:MAG: hypothetical protein R8G33_10525 [Gammaproteobacteria bacterium]|nr:hypothetical protein [Gammaproteobacteria bacterium]